MCSNNLIISFIGMCSSKLIFSSVQMPYSPNCNCTSLCLPNVYSIPLSRIVFLFLYQDIYLPTYTAMRRELVHYIYYEGIDRRAVPENRLDRIIVLPDSIDHVSQVIRTDSIIFKNPQTS